MANLSMTIGAYQQFQIVVTKSGAPVDLTGIASLTFTIQLPNGTVLATWGLGTGITNPNPTTGVALLTVTPPMTAFATGYISALYTTSMADAFGNPTPAMEQGTFSLTPPP